MAVDHKVDQWSPLRGNGDAVVPMPQAVDEKQTPLGSPQTVHQESIAEGLYRFCIGFDYMLSLRQSHCSVR